MRTSDIIRGIISLSIVLLFLGFMFVPYQNNNTHCKELGYDYYVTASRSNEASCFMSMDYNKNTGSLKECYSPIESNIPASAWCANLGVSK